MPTIAFLANLSTAEHKRRWDLLNENAGDDVNVIVVDPTTSPGEMIEAMKDVDAAIPWLASVPLEVAEHLPNLKLVQLLTAGYDSVDVVGLSKLGVAVANNGGSNAISVSEHAMTLMLSVYRRMMESWTSVKDGTWRIGVDQLPVRTEINGKTIGIIGFGNIGRQVARRLSGFDCEVLYHDTIELMPGRDQELGAQAVDLDHLLRVSDIVTVHVPLNSSTRGMMGSREFGLMKKTAIFINTCRGPVHNEAELITALEDGEIAGAGLDVLEVEPTDPNNPLLSMPTAIVTPHWAGGTGEGNERAVIFALSNLQRAAEDRKMLSVVDPSAIF
ncbi:MAG TPA: lactate dehydrogenase [Dehalococcoidia bacterium]|jgi:phosphoglycerate dehydrogenase-like enzyme|nr:lactate dehydrogenase [Dehalococcoidia bacterium]HIK88726.1 lactate dehydrogenase [Dehalococcoidia bacterium]